MKSQKQRVKKLFLRIVLTRLSTTRLLYTTYLISLLYHRAYRSPNSPKPIAEALLSLRHTMSSLQVSVRHLLKLIQDAKVHSTITTSEGHITITPEEAIGLRFMFGAIADDWSDPSMDVYDMHHPWDDDNDSPDMDVYDEPDYPFMDG